MSKLAQLRERRNAKAKEANALNDKYPADQRMASDDATKMDALLAEIEAIDDEVGRETRLNEEFERFKRNLEQQSFYKSAGGGP